MGLAKINYSEVEMSEGLKFASLRSARWPESMMLINSYRHIGKSHSTEQMAAGQGKGNPQRNPREQVFLNGLAHQKQNNAGAYVQCRTCFINVDLLMTITY